MLNPPPLVRLVDPPELIPTRKYTPRKTRAVRALEGSAAQMRTLLRLEVRRAGLSHEAMARMSGVSHPHMSRMLAGDVAINFRTVDRMMRHLRCHLVFIVEGKNDTAE